MLNRTPIAQQLRERINKWHYMKLKNFCTAKEIVTKLKRQPTERPQRIEEIPCQLYN
jgi:hypothetical protein